MGWQYQMATLSIGLWMWFNLATNYISHGILLKCNYGVWFPLPCLRVGCGEKRVWFGALVCGSTEELPFFLLSSHSFWEQLSREKNVPHKCKQVTKSTTDKSKCLWIEVCPLPGIQDRVMGAFVSFYANLLSRKLK